METEWNKYPVFHLDLNAEKYDKPLLQAITNLQLLEDYRQTLKAFYGVLKFDN